MGWLPQTVLLRIETRGFMRLSGHPGQGVTVPMDIKTTCLGVLALGNASGYEIRKAFEEGPFSHFADGNFGSIYPALNKLEKEEHVTGTLTAQEKRPAKKVYAITSKGRLALMDALAKSPVEDKFKSDFLFAMFFADYMAPGHVEALLDERIASMRERIAMMEECTHAKTEGARFVHDFGLHIYRASLDFLEAEKHRPVAAALQGEDPANDDSQAAE